MQQPMLPQHLEATGHWLSKNFGLSLPPNQLDEATLVKILAQRLEKLVNDDFEQFIQLLYRIDVPEIKVKELLATGEYPEVYYHIARLIIDRQVQKFISRQANKNNNPQDDDGEERW
ncbi:hypothetical protein COR50_03685 [Chitinophaga caeni]|uniref:Uncharacterized protein n=1 Tax=Chitinophaga caeni TaxID=2029983 RepID=A0A291QQY8_9BACT|nr:hypothetical protein [Chitinophaga caeni]ATL46346.1 hypothetical protein COR50_03685 [Chitinophaga caeni]